jgi:hypothetical protein
MVDDAEAPLRDETVHVEAPFERRPYELEDVPDAIRGHTGFRRTDGEIDVNAWGSTGRSENLLEPVVPEPWARRSPDDNAAAKE